MNGQDEKTNELLLERIRKWCMQDYNYWDEDLTAAIFACNTCKVSTTGFSALEMLMGYTANTASSIKYIRTSKADMQEKLKAVESSSLKEALHSRLQVLESLRDEVIRIKNVNVERMKQRYDRKVRSTNLDVGTEVLLFDSTLLKQWSRKLEERWLGPFVIKWRGTSGAYGIEDETGKFKLVSGDQLKPYYRR